MHLVGIDGGGTKTDCVVVTTEGDFVAEGAAGPSNVRNIGIKEATLNIGKAVESALLKVKNPSVKMIVVGIPAFAEEYKDREEEIKEALLEKINNFSISKEQIVIKSDQEVAFRSGTDEKNGVVAIAGTGSVVRGWNNGKDVKISGWGHYTDCSGAQYIGQQAYKRTVEAVDEVVERTLLTEMILERFETQSITDMSKIVYENDMTEVFAPLSIIVNEAAMKGDEVAQKILTDASNNLLLLTRKAVEKLSYEEKFAVVLVGSMFKSKFFADNFIKGVLASFIKADIIIPNTRPVFGAVKIAKEIT